MRTILLLAVLFLPAPAFAGQTWKCGGGIEVPLGGDCDAARAARRHELAEEATIRGATIYIPPQERDPTLDRLDRFMDQQESDRFQRMMDDAVDHDALGRPFR